MWECIAPSIRISWDYHPTFMSTLRFGRSKTNIHWMFCSISGRVLRSKSTDEQAHVDLDLLTLASCLNYHLLFCYVYTILCISRIFCCICNFFHQNAASVRKLASNHGTESISSFCTNVQYLKCIKDAGRQKGRSSVTILSNVQNK